MTRQAKYKIGDIVKLRSGGPEMTVESVPTESVPTFNQYRGEHYSCQWFVGKKLENGTFKEDALELAQENLV